MAAITQPRAWGAMTGRRYGSFSDRAVVVPTAEGLDFSSEINRLHYSGEKNQVHFVSDAQRLHWKAVN